VFLALKTLFLIATIGVDLWQILAKILYKNTLLRPYMALHLNDLFTISICSYGPTPKAFCGWISDVRLSLSVF